MVTSVENRVKIRLVEEDVASRRCGYCDNELPKEKEKHFVSLYGYHYCDDKCYRMFCED